jgi:hypothetical protein
MCLEVTSKNANLRTNIPPLIFSLLWGKKWMHISILSENKEDYL